jgi:hypothetical protein
MVVRCPKRFPLGKHSRIYKCREEEGQLYLLGTKGAVHGEVSCHTIMSPVWK